MKYILLELGGGTSQFLYYNEDGSHTISKYGKDVEGYDFVTISQALADCSRDQLNLDYDLKRSELSLEVLYGIDVDDSVRSRLSESFQREGLGRVTEHTFESKAFVYLNDIRRLARASAALFLYSDNEDLYSSLVEMPDGRLLGRKKLDNEGNDPRIEPATRRIFEDIRDYTDLDYAHAAPSIRDALARFIADGRPTLGEIELPDGTRHNPYWSRNYMEGGTTLMGDRISREFLELVSSNDVKPHDCAVIFLGFTTGNTCFQDAMKRFNPHIDFTPTMADKLRKRILSELETARPDPALSVSQSSLTFRTEEGTPASQTFTVKGTSLTQDVNVSVKGGDGVIIVNPSVVSATDAQAGAVVTVTFTPSSAGNYNATVSLISGSASASIGLEGTATAKPIPNTKYPWQENTVPVINVGKQKITLKTKVGMNVKDKFDVHGDNLTEVISVRLDDGNDVFKINCHTIPLMEDTSVACPTFIYVTFCPKNPGTYEGSITLTSGNISRVVNLSGVAEEASDGTNPPQEHQSLVEYYSNLADKGWNLFLFIVCAIMSIVMMHHWPWSKYSFYVPWGVMAIGVLFVWQIFKSKSEWKVPDKVEIKDGKDYINGLNKYSWTSIFLSHLCWILLAFVLTILLPIFSDKLVPEPRNYVFARLTLWVKLTCLLLSYCGKVIAVLTLVSFVYRFLQKLFGINDRNDFLSRNFLSMMPFSRLDVATNNHFASVLFGWTWRLFWMGLWVTIFWLFMTFCLDGDLYNSKLNSWDPEVTESPGGPGGGAPQDPPKDTPKHTDIKSMSFKEGNSGEVKLGKKLQLHLVVKPDNHDEILENPKSTNEEVAVVSRNGKTYYVTPKKPGECTISVKSSRTGKVASFKVLVKEDDSTRPKQNEEVEPKTEPKPKSINVERMYFEEGVMREVNAGDRFELHLVAEPANHDEEMGSPQWTKDVFNNTVAIVSKIDSRTYLVKTMRPGVCTITVSSSRTNETASFKVRVK